jgi:arsenite methyltransferase
MDSQAIYDRVTAHYTAAALQSNVPAARSVAQAFGYTDEELTHLPEGANLGLSCGNPLAMASLREVRLFPSSRLLPPLNQINGTQCRRERLF